MGAVRGTAWEGFAAAFHRKQPEKGGENYSKPEKREREDKWKGHTPRVQLTRVVGAAGTHGEPLRKKKRFLQSSLGLDTRVPPTPTSAHLSGGAERGRLTFCSAGRWVHPPVGDFSYLFPCLSPAHLPLVTEGKERAFKLDFFRNDTALGSPGSQHLHSHRAPLCPTGDTGPEHEEPPAAPAPWS